MNIRSNRSILSSLLLAVSLLFSVGCDGPSSKETKVAASAQEKVLVGPEWLKNQMIADTNLVVAKAMYKRPSGRYIPGSIHINTDEIEYDKFRPRKGAPWSKLERTTTEEQDHAKGLSPSDSLSRNWWNLYPDEYLLKAIAHMGITISSRVVMYGESPDPAARLVWCLKYAGVEHVYFLNGGLRAWIDAGNSTTTSPAKRTPVQYFGASRPTSQKYMATTEYIRRVVANDNPDFQIVDVRTYGEHIGEVQYYQYIPTKGRISNSMFGRNTDDTDSPRNDYYGENHEIFLSATDTIWREMGITRDKQISFYCGTGWRSSLAWLIAYELGYSHIKNYDGGWYEWSMGPERESNPSNIGQ